MDIFTLLEKFKNGEIDIVEVERELRLMYLRVDGTARLDIHRAKRTGVPEAILAEGKRVEDLKRIVHHQLERVGRCIVTRVTPAHRRALEELIEEEKIPHTWNEEARTMQLYYREIAKTGGRLGIITAGTSDIPVAEEARVIAEEMGCEVYTLYDAGVAGIHRLFPDLQKMIEEGVDAIVVAAGREGTLPAIIAGLVDSPVIGVPVSTGYGEGGDGKAALLSMLQSCSVLGVVNIDSGFTAGAFAAQIANRVARARKGRA
ncbi:N5-carboxyaminoimidazole ribonucleotide mutase [Candidatus Methanoperedenaceae archaeon GB50]|nr:N5-carboxyaminoimidazole ribonucleotide mutase [Candidatus Methanoperedenaceae archaeon GB50]